ncbi:MAG: FtsX-like permease family protein [Bradymonadales bacterium]|nr:MAG: FtsX-like permease family protein [Bradymonadales bacterium]
MNQLLRVSLRELWAGRRRLWLPAFALVLAISSLFVFRSFETQVQQKLLVEGRAQLGGDFSIQSLQPLPDSVFSQLEAELPPGSEWVEEISFTTMLQIPEREESQFVNLSAVGSLYPFYQTYQMEGFSRFSDLDQDQAFVILPRSLAELLDIGLGENLSLGVLDLRLGGIVETQHSGFSGFLSFAPKIWIHQRHLEETGLLTRPGRVFYSAHIRLPSESNTDQVVAGFENRLDADSFRVLSFRESNRAFRRIFDQVSLFAQLISLAALLISGFALLGAFRNWSFDRRYLVAVLRSLGAGRRQVAIIFFGAISIFALAASFLGCLLGAVFVGLGAPLLSEMIGLSLSAELSMEVSVFCFLVGFFLPILFSLWPFLDLKQFRPLLLLRHQSSLPTFGFSKVAVLILIFCIFSGISLYLLGSFRISARFLGGLSVVFLGGLLVNFAILWTLGQIPRNSWPLSLRYSLRSLLRERATSLLSATIFFLLSFILGLALILELSFREEFRVEDSVRQASLLVFDLGEEEKLKLDALVSDFSGASLQWAPWVGLRWVTVNDRPVEELNPTESFFRSDFLVTEAMELGSQERIVEGELWTTPFDGQGLPELSLTREYFRRYGVQLGDRMGFELYGIPFEGRVTSLRTVKWTDFQPGFRIVFQKDFFKGLPFSYLGTILTEPSAERLELRRAIGREFPAISLLDVSSIKEDLVRVMGELSMAIRFILSFLFFLAIVMVAVLTHEKMSSRWRDFASLRCVGATSLWLRACLGVELISVVFFPTIIGLLFGLLSSSWFLDEFFNLEAQGTARLLALVPLIILGSVLLVAWWLSRNLKTLKPKLLLQTT